MTFQRTARTAGLAAIVAALPLFAASAVAQTANPAVAQAPPAEIKPLASGRPANSFSNYQALRSIAPTGEAFNIEGVTLKRDEGELTLHKGTVYLYPPVNGQVTGAVFLGSGTFHLKPPGANEQKSLTLFIKSNEMNQEVSTVVLRFTDGTADELRKASAGTAAHAAAADSAAANLATAFRKKININLDSRILQDVMSGKPGGLFLASFKGSGLFGRSILYEVDPQGAAGASPDQIEVANYDEDHFDVWTAFDPSTPADPHLHGASVHITNHALDTTIEKNGRLSGSAITTFTALHDQLRIVPLNLYGKLRVTGVYGPGGEPLDFVQEGEHWDPQFAIVMAHPLAQGQSVSVRVDYNGKDVVFPEGEGNYYPAGDARESWYPNGYEGFGSYSSFQMTFHVPKGLMIVATGQRVSATESGGQAVTVWKTEAPIAVAGFNLGAFKEADSKTASGFGVEAYANTEPPDFAKSLLRQVDTRSSAAGRQVAAGVTLGTMSTTSALKQTLAEGTAAMEIYTNFFGPLSYDHVALTQQSACDYGQSWPMLVYLPICSFWDDTIKEQLGLFRGDRAYWTVVTPHEVAH